MVRYMYIGFLVYVFDMLSSVSPQYQIITEICPVDATLTNVDEKTDGRTEMTKVISALRHYTKRVYMSRD